MGQLSTLDAFVYSAIDPAASVYKTQIVEMQDALQFNTVSLLRGWDIVGPLYESFLYGLGFVAGGFANHAATALKEKENFGFAREQPPAFDDIDIYGLDKQAIDAIKKNLEASDWILQSETDYSYKYVREGEETDNTPKVNLIKMTSGSPEQVLDTFDLSVAQAAILSKTEVLVSDKWLKTHDTNKLLPHNISTPSSTILRLAKYAKRGYRIPHTTALEVLEGWRKLPDIKREELVEWIGTHAGDEEMYHD